MEPIRSTVPDFTLSLPLSKSWRSSLLIQARSRSQTTLELLFWVVAPKLPSSLSHCSTEIGLPHYALLGCWSPILLPTARHFEVFTQRGIIVPFSCIEPQT